MDQQISSELPHIETAGNPEAGVPVQDAVVAAGNSERQTAQGLEQARPTQGQPLPAASQSSLAQAFQAASPPDPATLAAAGSPQMADDADLIEKEWVIKAKEIVERTKHDPYQHQYE